MKTRSGSGGVSVSAHRLSEEEFVLRAIRNLRVQPYKGIHTRNSGFNAAFRKYFGSDPVVATKRLAEAGVVVMRRAKGGAVLYLPSEAPALSPPTDAALQKILG